MAGFIEASNISKQIPPTPIVNDEESPGEMATAPSFSPISQKVSTDGSNEISLRRREGRLSCDHPGCNKTFPRNYELKRHTKNIHTQKFQVFCHVYGCHRTTKPFKRADKFNEHFRKHSSSRSYRCLIETCQSAPFDIPGLSDHLTKGHHIDYDAQPNLDFIHYTVFGSGSVPFWFHRLCLTGRDICPLAHVGCTYRSKSDCKESRSGFTMRQHILNHDLSDRRQGSELLRSFFTGFYRGALDDGTKNCMLCSFQANGCFHQEFLVDHMVTDHSQEERCSVLKDTHRFIAEFLYMWQHQREGKQLNVIVLSNECRGAGLRLARWQENFLRRLEEN
ncbi:hypothetical protein EAE96_002862 [Botrytis aclada]|nr:hypothetical protein EAE96_002862 [Botrytis aclada]